MGLAWYESLTTSYPEMRREWKDFTRAGGDLPLIEEVLGFPDQNQGSYWKLAPIVSQGRPSPRRSWQPSTPKLIANR